MLLSALSFGLMQIFVALNGADIGIMEQTFFRNLIGMIILAPLIRREHATFFGPRRYQPQLFARSTAGFFAILLLFYASRNAAQADVAILNRVEMFTITAVSAAFLGEKLTKMHIPAMVIAFTGAFIAADPSFDSSFLPLLAAFGSALCDTVAYPLLSYFSGRVNPLTVIFHFSAFSTALSFPLMLREFVMPGGWDLLCLIMIGVTAAGGQIAMNFSYRMAPAGELSVYNQAGIPISAALGFLFLGEIPGARTWVGGALVLLASVLLFFYKRAALRRQEALA